MIPGGRIGFLGASEYLRNSIYELVDSASLDGAVIWSSSLTGAENADSITSFVRGISERLPVVSMCMDIPGIPSVDFDAYAGTYQATMHFIKDHGARRIAFLRGPASHRSAEARYKAYLDALRDGGIEPDPDLVTSPRPWSEGAEAASELICARKLRAGSDFEAVVAASDLLVFGAVPVFREAGISIPDDIGISGFNDNEENQLLDVELTTVRMPIRRILEQAYRMIASIEDGRKDEAGTAVLPSEFIIRRSCGCSDSMGGVDHALARISDEESFLRWLSDILDDSTAYSCMQRILRFLFEEDEPDKGEFAEALAEYFDTGAEADVIIEAVRWSESILGRREKSPGRRDYLISRIIHGSRRLYIREQKRISEVSRILDAFKTELLAARSYSALSEIMQSIFPSLGITGAAIMLFDDFQYTSMIGGFSGNRIFPERVRFPRKLMIPESLSSFMEKGVFVVEPLFIDKQELGYLLVATEWCEGHILEDIRAAISSSMKGISLTEVAQKAAESAEEGERRAGEFYASVSEALRGPLSAMHRMLSGKGRIPRSEMADEVRRAEHMLSLSLAEFGELDMEKALIPSDAFLSSLSSSLGAEIDAPEELPAMEADPELITELFSAISSVIAPDAVISISVSLSVHSILFRVRGDGKLAKEDDPAVMLASKIAVLHSGEISFDSDGALLSLPYPTLSGHQGPAQENGPVVWLSGRDVPEALIPLSPVSISESDAQEVFKLSPRPAAIAWRRSKGSVGSSVLRTLRSHRFSRSLPFIAFGIEERAVSLPVALECDRTDTDDSVIYSMPRLPQLERIFSDFGRVEDGLSPDTILSGDGNARMVVLSEISGSTVYAFRRSRRFASVPILIVRDSFTEAEVGEIADIPNVIIVNSAVLDAPDFISRLVSVLSGSELLPPLTGAIVKRAIVYLNRHLPHQISRWQVAESVNISEDYLTRIFRREMGVSPWDYLTRCRVGVASDLLLRTGVPLGEIAVAAGFQDQAYFCRVFRRITGISPGQFRQRG